MKKINFKLIFAIFTIIFSLFYAFPWAEKWIDTFLWEKEYKLWLDLSWGIVLDYKVDLEEAKNEEWYDQTRENNIIEWLKWIVDRRISSLNINDSIITSSSYWDERHIIVEIPLASENSEENNENIKKAKEAIWKVVKINFKERNLEISEEDYEKRFQIATKALEEIKASEYDFEVSAKKYRDSYEKVEYKVAKIEENEFKNAFNLDNTKAGLIEEVIKTDENFSVLSMIDWKVNAIWWEWNWIINIIDTKDSEDEKIVEFEYLFINAIPSDWKIAVDSEWRSLSDKYFENASVSYTQAWQPQVQLVFNNEWWKIFANLTERLQWQQIAIFVGWEMITAPNVNQKITWWTAVITWNYTDLEAREMANNINTWVIPAPIYLTSENNIDSKLWANSLSKLILAWIVWLSLIIAFLIYTYRIWWVIAWISLIAYTWVVLSMVKYYESVLTLASIAGLVLSIWMAIDANILIFERIKDNLKKWFPIENSTEDWFNSSWTAIWDTNVTGLIIAIILYIFGINMIKWFWLMLAIWTIVSLFTVMFISRVLIISYAKNYKNKHNLVWKYKEQ